MWELPSYLQQNEYHQPRDQPLRHAMNLNISLEYQWVKALIPLETDNSVEHDWDFHHNDRLWVVLKVARRPQTTVLALFHVRMWLDERCPHRLPYLRIVR